MKVIGHIRTDFPSKFGIPRQSGLIDGLKGKIILEPEYRNPQVYKGIEEFSHIWLLWEFSEAKKEHWSATVKPPRLGGKKRMGVFATKGTAKVLNDNGVKALEVHKIEQESPNLLDLILGHEIDLVIDIPQQGAERSHDGFVIRRNAIETGVNVLTALDTAAALATSLENRAKELSLIDIATVQ